MSGLQGGGDRTLLRGLNPDGNIQHEHGGVRVVGNLKGDAYGLNIANPRPGFVYQYADEQSNRGTVLRALQRGWQRVDPQRDGCPAGVLLDQQSNTHTPLNTAESPLFPGLVALMTTEENFRRLQEERQAANEEALNPGSDSFLERAEDGDARFAQRGHGMTYTEGERVLQQHTPSGVLREE
jgi:hypothetical protein